MVQKFGTWCTKLTGRHQSAIAGHQRSVICWDNKGRKLDPSTLLRKKVKVFWWLCALLYSSVHLLINTASPAIPLSQLYGETYRRWWVNTRRNQCKSSAAKLHWWYTLEAAKCYVCVPCSPSTFWAYRFIRNWPLAVPPILKDWIHVERILEPGSRLQREALLANWPICSYFWTLRWSYRSTAQTTRVNVVDQKWKRSRRVQLIHAPNLRPRN